MAIARKKKHEYGVRFWRLEFKDPAKNANKFYEVYIIDNGLTILRWGRIGTLGQMKAHSMSTLADAETIGLRQVYAKQGKGYRAAYDDLRFLVDESTVDYAQRGNSGPLNKVTAEALANGAFGGARDTVLKHYSDFSTQVQDLLHRASTMDFEVVIDEYGALEKVWEEIEDKHREVVAAMGLAKQTLMQKLVGAI